MVARYRPHAEDHVDRPDGAPRDYEREFVPERMTGWPLVIVWTLGPLLGWFIFIGVVMALYEVISWARATW